MLKLQRYLYTLSARIKCKGLTIPSTVEDVKEVQLIVAAQIGTITLKNCLAMSNRAQHACYLWPSNSTSRYNPIEMHTYEV